MEKIIIAVVLAFIITYYTIPVIIKIANAKKLFDVPDDKRKLHARPIPSLGGFGIFAGFTLALLITMSFTQATEFQYYIAAFTIIFFIGLKDDILVISARRKLIWQLVVAGILIFKADLLITGMQGLLGVHALPTILSYLLTMFVIVVIVNAFNLIDGVDGLAGTIGLITSVAFAAFFWLNGNVPYAVLGFTFAASLLAFLIYNFHPAKIFMGDTGSLMIGLVNSILVIKFVQTGSSHSVLPVTAPAAVGFAIILLPLMDTLRVFTTRIFQGRSPFSPDRNHIHHLLLDRGFNHRSVVYACAITTCVSITSAFFLQVLGTTSTVVVLVASFFILVYLLSLKSSTRLWIIKGEVKKWPATEETGRKRLVSFYAKKAEAVGDE